MPVDTGGRTKEGPCIAGVGASAGGLAAVQEMLRHVDPGCGVAFVVVQHLDPHQASHLTSILASHSGLRIVEATEGVRVEAETVYVMPSGRTMTIRQGHLHLAGRPEGLHFPIDEFLTSLAADQGERAIGVILTGTGHDGSAGVQAIHDQGGTVIVQDPEEAEFPEMPRNAIETGAVDAVVPLAAIAQPAARLAYPEHEGDDESVLDATMRALSEGGPPDFRGYRPATLRRRLERRMALRGMDPPEYLRLLESDPDEADRLRSDMLLGVTSFFRDGTSFRDLASTVVPDLFADHRDVRVWVAGCSTGEEAYSIAMLLLEQRDAHPERSFQVFATDVRPAAIAIARRGTYTEQQMQGISASRRRRFFEPVGQGRYRVRRELREMIAFAVHDLLEDPPLPSMGLVSCRNVLIYLRPEAQRRVLTTFHFALRPGGHLLLGTSEHAGDDSGFAPTSKTSRLYRRKDHKAARRSPAARPTAAASPRITEPADAARAWLLEHHTPAAVAVDSSRQIVYAHGPVGSYMRLSTGAPSLDVLAMATSPLRARLRKALLQDGPTRFIGAGETGGIEVRVEPISGTDLKLITFRPTAAEPVTDTATPSDSIAEGLEEELLNLRQRLDETVAQASASEEELRATNEEVASMNEELRATVEELEASKEELLSLNDELQAVNRRLTDETRLARELSDDLSNLFGSTGIPVLFLDMDLRLRRSTTPAAEFFTQTPPGTPVAELPMLYRDRDLLADARHVLRDLRPITREVRAPDGRRHHRSILPYRTAGGGVEGVVVLFEDIEDLRRIDDELRDAEAYNAAIVRAVPAPLLVLAPDLSIRAANPAFHAQFGILPDDAQSRRLPDLLGEQWDLEPLRRLLQEGQDAHGLEVQHTQDGSRFVFRLEARALPAMDQTARILLVLHDVTAMKQVERDLLSFTAQLHRRVEAQTSAALEKARLLERVAYAIGHDLQEPVRSMGVWLDELGRQHREELSTEGQDMLRHVHAENRRLTGLVRGLLAFTRSLQEDVHRVYPVSVRAALASEDCRSRFEKLAQERDAVIDVVGDDRSVLASLPAMGYILGNLVQNAIYHNHGRDPQVTVRLTDAPRGQVGLTVEDNGPGIPEEVVAGLDEKGVATRGFGLAIAKQMAEFLGGSLQVASKKGGGTAVHVRLPRAPSPGADD